MRTRIDRGQQYSTADTSATPAGLTWCVTSVPPQQRKANKPEKKPKQHTDQKQGEAERGRTAIQTQSDNYREGEEGSREAAQDRGREGTQEPERVLQCLNRRPMGGSWIIADEYLSKKRRALQQRTQRGVEGNFPTQGHRPLMPRGARGEIYHSRWELAGRETARGIYHSSGNWQVGRREEKFTTAGANWQVGRREEDLPLLNEQPELSLTKHLWGSLGKVSKLADHCLSYAGLCTLDCAQTVPRHVYGTCCRQT